MTAACINIEHRPNYTDGRRKGSGGKIIETDLTLKCTDEKDTKIVLGNNYTVTPCLHTVQIARQYGELGIVISLDLASALI